MGRRQRGDCVTCAHVRYHLTAEWAVPLPHVAASQEPSESARKSQGDLQDIWGRVCAPELRFGALGDRPWRSLTWGLEQHSFEMLWAGSCMNRYFAPVRLTVHTSSKNFLRVVCRVNGPSSKHAVSVKVLAPIELCPNLVSFAAQNAENARFRARLCT